VLLALLASTPLPARAQLTELGGPPIPAPPGGGVTATVDGETRNQAVGQAEIELSVELTGPEQVEIGRPYALVVAVHNHSPSVARNVRVPITLAVTAADGTAGDPRGLVLFAGADPVACARSGRDRACAFGDIPSGESRSTTIRLEVRPATREGRMAFATTAQADARLGADSRVQQRKEVALVRNARQRLDVDLRLAMTREATVVGPGERFAYVVQVTNASDRTEATDVDLDVRARFGVRDRGKFRRPAGDGFRTTVASEPAVPCRQTGEAQRCRLGTIRPREVRRVTVEVTVVQDLEPRRWGRVAVHASVASAENDPAGRDNFARDFTNVVSRRPEIAFFARTRDARGQLAIAPVETLVAGDIFGVAARYMALAVEPSGAQPWVRISVDGGDAVDVALSQTEKIGSDRLFRSPLLRVLAPGQTPPAGESNVRVIRAAPGQVVKVVYEMAHPVTGASRAETSAAVRARPAPAKPPPAPR
jgi:hypothetical protein